MSQLAHGRSTFAMISANCVAGRDRGKGLPVLSARQFIGAATTALSLITGAFLLALAAGNARAQGSAPACDAADEIALLPSPWAPWKGAPLRVMLVTEKPLQGELSLTGPDGSVAATSRARKTSACAETHCYASPRFVFGDQFGRTAAPINPHRVQTIRGHSDRTGVS